MRPDQPPCEPDRSRRWGRRREPMPRRGTDIVEAVASWLMGVLGILGVAGAFFLGSDVHQHTVGQAGEKAAQHDSRTRHLPTSVPALVAIDQGEHAGAPAPVNHLTVDGARPHRGVVSLTRLPLTPGRADSQQPRPPQRLILGTKNAVTAMTYACWSIAVALASVAAGLWVTWRLVARWTSARNDERWEREWAEVEPVWSGRAPRRPGGHRS